MPRPLPRLLRLPAAAALVALGAATARAGDGEPVRAAAATPTAGAPTAVLLLVVTTPEGTAATFGQGGGQAGPAGEALAREVEALGFQLRSAAGQTVAVSGEGDPLLPVGDQAALDLARRLGASSAWVVGLDVRPDGPIRGTRLTGAAGRGKLRVLDVAAGSAVASAEAVGAGYDAALAPAAAAAGRDAIARLAASVTGEVRSRWPKAASGGPTVLIRLRGARTWSSISAIIHRLGATEGVRAVHPRQVWQGRVALAVDTGLSAARVAAAVERARLPRGTVRAAARGSAEVEAEVRGETPFSSGVEAIPNEGP
ncbi:MAG TPA: hypothetical protein VKZ63_20180 [Kofleriaceae bacterium]|nr:hypothetical protein [Kofleriaceae bacterium]